MSRAVHSLRLPFAFVALFGFATAACSGGVAASSNASDASDTSDAGNSDGSSPQPGVDGGPTPYHADASTDSAPQPPCAAGYLGSSTAPIAFEISALGDSPTELRLADGDVAPMMLPPQGGRVVFVGVRATNLDGCAMKLSAAFRDTTSRAIRLDARTVNLTARGDGWGTVGEPDGRIGNQGDYANVPVCPNEWSARDIYGQTYELEVTITDRFGKTATKIIHTVPQCAGPDPSWQPCACICKAGYKLGQSCGS